MCDRKDCWCRDPRGGKAYSGNAACHEGKEHGQVGEDGLVLIKEIFVKIPSGRGATKRGQAGRKSGLPGSPDRSPRKLDLSPRRSPCLRCREAAESARRLPLNVKPSRDRVVHTK